MKFDNGLRLTEGLSCRQGWMPMLVPPSDRLVGSVARGSVPAEDPLYFGRGLSGLLEPALRACV